jgi:hypothetical protein
VSMEVAEKAGNSFVTLRNMKRPLTGALNLHKSLIYLGSGTRTRTGDLRIMIPPL